MDESGGLDVGLAYKLYGTLFGPVADLIRDKKHLIVVPSGALTSLPFQVLITEKPEGTQRLSDAAWVIKRHAITVLPSVASLRALRAFAKGTRTGKPFIGFGNPVFQKAPSGLFRQAAQRLIAFSIPFAAPPSSVMNSRLLTRSPRRRGQATKAGS